MEFYLKVPWGIRYNIIKFLDNKNSFTEDDWSEIYNLSLKTYVDGIREDGFAPF